jgi:hypothetical protein
MTGVFPDQMDKDLCSMSRPKEAARETASTVAWKEKGHKESKLKR